MKRSPIWSADAPLPSLPPEQRRPTSGVALVALMGGHHDRGDRAGRDRDRGAVALTQEMSMGVAAGYAAALALHRLVARGPAPRELIEATVRSAVGDALAPHCEPELVAAFQQGVVEALAFPETQDADQP